MTALQLRRLKKMKMWILVLAILVMGVVPSFAESGSGSGSGSGSSGGGTEIRLRARLTGNAIGNLIPSGQADFRSRAGRFVRFSTEVENVKLPVDSQLEVFVSSSAVCSGTLLGNIVLGPPPIRGGDLNLDTRDGDTVPQLTAGKLVSVCFNGVPVVSGKLKINQ
jgi:hypothetical protein